MKGDGDQTRVRKKMSCCLRTEQGARSKMWPVRENVFMLPQKQENIPTTILFLPVESPKDSSSYALRWFPEVCAHNVTKGEKTATVQVCLVDLFIYTTAYIFKTLHTNPRTAHAKCLTSLE